MTGNVNDFVSVENGNVVVWTADGHMLTVVICARATQAELGVEAIKNALGTYEGWVRE